jgi:hypothetical protein
MSWSDDQGYSADLVTHGTVRWNEDYSDVVSISPGGSLEVSTRGGGHHAHVEIAPGESGLARSMAIDGVSRAWDAAWFASFAEELDRHTGFAAGARFPALYRERGAAGVLAHVATLRSDLAMREYLSRLIDADPLEEKATLGILDQVERLNGGYEISQVLIALAGKSRLSTEAERAAYLRACSRIRGDYERSRTLRPLLDRSDLSPALVRDVLGAIAAIGGNYEKAESMVALAQRYAADAPEYLKVAATISGGYEHARVLKALIAAEKLDEPSQIEVIRQTARLGEYETSMVLIALAQRTQPSGAALREYEAAAGRLGEYARDQTLAALHRVPRR